MLEVGKTRLCWDVLREWKIENLFHPQGVKLVSVSLIIEKNQAHPEHRPWTHSLSISHLHFPKFFLRQLLR
jgi:hypothetical protein